MKLKYNMTQYIDKSALVSEIKRLIDCCYKICAGNLDFLQKSYPEHYYSIETYKEILSFIDTLEVKDVQEEPVSKNLEEAASQYPSIIYHISPQWKSEVENVFKAGAEWHKVNLWKDAQGDDLPEIDREVIALLDNGKVVFAHRPPEYWDGKNILTGKVTRYEPKRYDKGGWNQSNVVYWLDVELPKEENKL